MKHDIDCGKGAHCQCDPPEPDPNDPIDDGYDPDLIFDFDGICGKPSPDGVNRCEFGAGHDGGCGVWEMA